MRKFKWIFALLLCLILLLTAGCKGKNLTAIQPSEENGREEVAAAFNEAVRLLQEAESYTITGSVNSTSIMGETITSVVSSVHIACAKQEGVPVFFAQTEERYDGKTYAHSTYGANGKFYISAMDSSYFVSSNDYGDFDGTAYAKMVEESAISACQLVDKEEGFQLGFQIPYGVYYSEALDHAFGVLVDESLQQKMLTLRAELDKDGRLQQLYIAVETTTDFDGEAIEQSVTLSLSFSDYNTTTVKAPENLEAYEDRSGTSSVSQNGDEDEPATEFTGDSLD